MLPREREGVKEAYNLFNEVADQLYGPEGHQPDTGAAVAAVEDSGEEDIDAAFDKVRRKWSPVCQDYLSH